MGRMDGKVAFVTGAACGQCFPGLRRGALHHRGGVTGRRRQLPEVGTASMTIKVAPETDVYYDPYDTGINTDPYPTFARLREEAPIYYNEQYDFWAISRHSDVEQALANWQVFSSRRSDILELVKSKFDMPGGVMMFQDPP